MIGRRIHFPNSRFLDVLIVISLGLSACHKSVPQDARPRSKSEVFINLLPLGIEHGEVFHKVRVNGLPRAVIRQMEGVADAGATI
jgi:hypothetical protein